MKRKPLFKITDETRMDWQALDFAPITRSLYSDGKLWWEISSEEYGFLRDETLRGAIDRAIHGDVAVKKIRISKTGRLTLALDKSRGGSLRRRNRP